MGERALGGAGIARLFVPADVLKRRDATIRSKPSATSNSTTSALITPGACS